MNHEIVPKSILEEIGRFDSDLRTLHIRTRAAEKVVDDLQQIAWNQLGLHRGVEDLMNVSNNMGAVIALAQSETGSKLGAAVAILAALQVHPRIAEVEALASLHTELAEALAAEEEVNRQRQLAENAVSDAEKQVREKHAEALASKPRTSPKVLAAQKSLAGIKRLGAPLVAEEPSRELAGDFH